MIFKKDETDGKQVDYCDEVMALKTGNIKSDPIKPSIGLVNCVS